MYDTKNHPFSTSRNRSPYFSSFRVPIPCISRSCAFVDGCRMAICTSVLSLKTIYAGTCSSLAIRIRSSFRRKNRAFCSPARSSERTAPAFAPALKPPDRPPAAVFSACCFTICYFIVSAWGSSKNSRPFREMRKTG